MYVEIAKYSLFFVLYFGFVSGVALFNMPCACVQAKHASEGCVSWGVNGENGEIVDMKDFGVWEAYSVKAQTYKTAIEVYRMPLISVLLLPPAKNRKVFCHI